MRRTLRFVFASFVLAASLLAQKPVATVQGRVLGPDGLPMPNVEVLAKAGVRDDAILAKARTDGVGMFVLARLPDDRGVAILAQPPGHTVSFAYAELSPDQPFAAVELRVYEANTLRGRVVDPDGKPIAGASVLGTKDRMWFHGSTQAVETKSDADGRFELHGVPIGDCVVRVYAPGFALREHTLVVFADRDIELPPLLREEGTTLAIAADGLRPEEAAKVRLWIYAMREGGGRRMPNTLENTTLAADGTCRFAGLPDAEWHVQPSLPGVSFEPRKAATKAGERNPRLQFRIAREGSTRIRGRLTDSTGKPLANESLVCHTLRAPATARGLSVRASTGADGRFSMDARMVASEPYSLQLVDSAHVLQQPKTPSMRGNSDPRFLVLWEGVAGPEDEVALVAVPAAMLTVTVCNRDRQPVPFLKLELQFDRASPQPRTMATATTSPDGIARFPCVHGLERGFVVFGSGPAGFVRSEPFRLVPGQHQRLELVATPLGRVEGIVVDGAGTPLAGVRVEMSSVDLVSGGQQGEFFYTVPSDRRGRYVFSGVVPDGYRIDVGATVKSDGEGRSEPFEVLPGGQVQVEVRVAR